jgi:tRNA threonylcarbamoyladenosine biosynthesis protein TsaB
MRILALDTSTKVLALGAYDNGRICEYNLETATRLSGLLIPSIKRVLAALGWKMSDIDYLACGLGPGSFTGVRVGMAAVKAISWSLNKPIAGISSLDILAMNAQVEDAFVIPVIDAKRGLIYSSVYRIKNNVLKKATPYMLLSPADLAARIKNKIGPGTGEKAVILGDAAGLYREEFRRSLPKARILDKDHWSIRAGNIVRLALEKIRIKELLGSFELNPIYLYPPDCQISKPKG